MKNETSDEDGERVVLTRDQADLLIEPGEFVHTFMQAGNRGLVLVGADWPRAKILNFADEGKCELAGPAAAVMSHGVVIFTPWGNVFVQTINKTAVDAPAESTL